MVLVKYGKMERLIICGFSLEKLNGSLWFGYG
jgi:hypothetical protein